MAERKSPRAASPKATSKATPKRASKQTIAQRAKTAPAPARQSKTKGKKKPQAPRPKTPIERGLRDLRILQWHSEGATLEEISVRDGRSHRQIQVVLTLYREQGLADGAQLLKKRPTQIVRGMLDRTALMYDAAFELACNTQNESIRLGALRTMIETERRRVELLQILGLLPKNLGVVRHIHEVEELAREMVQSIAALRRGELGAEVVEARFRQLAGLPDIDVEGRELPEEAA